MKVKAFKPLIFGKNLEHFYSPPFDTISPDQEKELKNFQYNITHVTLPESPDAALNTLNEWKKKGILKATDLNVLIIIKQEFSSESKKLERLGLLCGIRIYPESDDIKPHEKTFPGPRKNRFNLMDRTDCQPEPIFLVTSSAQLKETLKEAIASRSQYFKFEEPAGVINSVYIISDRTLENQIRNILSEKVAIVADGHHRLAASKEIARTRYMKRKNGWNYIMTYLCPSDDNCLMISGIHRIVKTLKNREESMKKLNEYFEISDTSGPDSQGIVYYDGSYHTLKLKEDKVAEIEGLDPTLAPDVVNKIIFSECFSFSDYEVETSVIYSHSALECIKSVDTGEAALTIFMPDWNNDDFYNRVSGGGLLPQKSTYFYPKVPSGIAVFEP